MVRKTRIGNETIHFLTNVPTIFVEETTINHTVHYQNKKLKGDKVSLRQKLGHKHENSLNRLQITKITPKFTPL